MDTDGEKRRKRPSEKPFRRPAAYHHLTALIKYPAVANPPINATAQNRLRGRFHTATTT
ncbi:MULTISPECIES: hypothetical protein [unclassified Neisseria]|uniref:hypothetical protein n=1 Tax=unclassified Neisseria TaxID=2623750 RepID=UPI001430346D|nr:MULTISPECIES: hypothetical protein [unclassified Neisseria]MBF0804223.1 hypothetical protein [Neisseria sp. 19428wB4_WF04]